MPRLTIVKKDEIFWPYLNSILSVHTIFQLHTICILDGIHLWHLYTQGQFLPSGIVVACVRPSVTKFVRAITHHLFKLISPQKDLGQDPYCCGGWFTLTFKVKFNFKINICPILSVQAMTTKFGPEVENTVVKILIVLRVDWAWQVKLNLISKSRLFAAHFAFLKYL